MRFKIGKIYQSNINEKKHHKICGAPYFPYLKNYFNFFK